MRRGASGEGVRAPGLGLRTSGARAWPGLRRNSWCLKAAGRWTRGVWWLAAPRQEQLPPSTTAPLPGQLSVASEWHELEGEFQELQAGPGHLVPKLCYLKCRVFPSCSPSPGRGNHQGPEVAPCQALRAEEAGVAGGLHGPAPSHLPGLHFSSTYARASPPRSRAFTGSLPRAPPLLQKVDL